MMAGGGGARTGQCSCGAVRVAASGPAKRVGLCHCLDCQHAHAAPVYHFAVYDAARVEVSGSLEHAVSDGGYDRAFCSVCGCYLVGFSGDEIELSVPCLDGAHELIPEYELWTIRRQPWLAPLDVPQYERNRDDA
jgi:hypothetical protein